MMKICKAGGIQMTEMKEIFGTGKHVASKLTAAVLCAAMIAGSAGASVLAAEAAEADMEDDPYRLVDIIVRKARRMRSAKSSFRRWSILSLHPLSPRR